MQKQLLKQIDYKSINKAFNALSRKDQRILILKDALRQIKIGKFKPTNGTYLEVEGFNSSLQVNLIEASKCDCCAKGAIFSSCVLNSNKVSSAEDYNDDSFVSKKLAKWFTRKELDMMEAAFELRADIGDTFNEYTDKIEELGEACVKFGEKYPSSSERLVAILKNTLKFGKFDPYSGKKQKQKNQ
jgi:hypothetical protein